MGSSLRRTREHSCFWTYPHKINGGKGSWCFCDYSRRHKGCARYTRSPESSRGWCGRSAFGYSFEATRNCYRGSECRPCPGESTHELRYRADDQRDWWSEYIDNGYRGYGPLADDGVQARRFGRLHDETISFGIAYNDESGDISKRKFVLAASSDRTSVMKMYKCFASAPRYLARR